MYLDKITVKENQTNIANAKTSGHWLGRLRKQGQVQGHKVINVYVLL